PANAAPTLGADRLRGKTADCLSRSLLLHDQSSLLILRRDDEIVHFHDQIFLLALARLAHSASDATRMFGADLLHGEPSDSLCLRRSLFFHNVLLAYNET